MSFTENAANPCYMRHYAGGKIIYRDDSNTMTYTEADRALYKHRYVEDREFTRSCMELSTEEMDAVMALVSLETEAGAQLDVVSIEGDDVIVAAPDQPGSVFRLAQSDLPKLLQPDNFGQLQDFYLPRALDDPYVIQFELNDLMVVY